MDQNKSAWISATIGMDTYRTEVVTETHELLADEPLDVGGKDLGPSAGDFLRIALASCTAITLRMYADRKKMDVTKIEVKVYTEVVGEKTIFNRSLRITGNITEEQEKRIVQIADACPVHKTFTHPIAIQTVLLR